MGSTTEDVVDNEQQVQPMEVELDQASAGASACLSRSGGGACVEVGDWCKAWRVSLARHAL